MHELSIAMNIVEIVEENARRENAACVKEVELDIGTQSGIMIEALEFAMESAVKGTILENAGLKINLIQGRAACKECGIEFHTLDLFTPCPDCGNPFCEIIGGRELRVKSLKIE